MMKLLAASALALTMTTSLVTAAEQIDTRHYIYIEANASVSAKADRATIRIEFSDKDSASEAASTASSAKIGKLLVLLKQIGVPADDIDASSFKLERVFVIAKDKDGRELDFRPNPQRDTFDGYLATRSVTVRLVDMGKIGAVLAAGIAAGGEITEPQFSVSNEDELVLQAKQKAAASALAKAQAYTSAVGTGLGDVLNIRENSGYDPDTMEIPPVDGYADLVTLVPPPTLPEPVPITIPNKTFSQSVSIKWEIAPKAK